MPAKRIILTGGTGYLGSHLTRQLVSQGHSVALLKRVSSNLRRIQDLTGKIRLLDIESNDLDSVFSEGKFDLVIHCATNYGRGNVPPLEVIEANLSLPIRLLTKAVEYKVPMFINTDTILDKRISTYSRSKKQFLDWMEGYSGDITCVNVAFEHFFGPDDDPSKFVSFIVRDIVAGVPHIDLTPGEQKRDFIYIDDAVNAFLSILEHESSLPRGLKKFEVGSGRKMPLRAFVELVKTIAGNKTTELRFGALPYRENEVMDTNVDLSGLLELGWQPRVSIEEGVQRTIARAKEV